MCGRWRAWTVVITLLTGIPAGDPDAQGEYPSGSVNQRVMARLKELTEFVGGKRRGPRMGRLATVRTTRPKPRRQAMADQDSRP